MANYQDASALKNLSLGKQTDYTHQYDASLLQAVPRSLNRNDLAIDQANLPFLGEDVWYGYELSWLNSKGKPVVAVAEFRVPCTSDNIIESKSFKLYLNSFNQTKFSSIEEVTATLSKDLSATANSEVKVTLFNVDSCPPLAIAPINAQCIDDIDIEVTTYDYQPSLLKLANDNATEIVEESLVSHLLKSNCLITNQPDWASVYISYKGPKIDLASLLEYLISFRQHNEFHEQCVERLFCDIQQYCNPEQLNIFARYTRRGGLDINPFRSSDKTEAPNARTLRQ